MNAQQDFLAVAQDRPRTGPFPICRQHAHMEGRSPDASAFTRRNLAGCLGSGFPLSLRGRSGKPQRRTHLIEPARDPSARASAWESFQHAVQDQQPIGSPSPFRLG